MTFAISRKVTRTERLKTGTSSSLEENYTLDAPSFSPYLTGDIFEAASDPALYIIGDDVSRMGN